MRAVVCRIVGEGVHQHHYDYVCLRPEAIASEHRVLLEPHGWSLLYASACATSPHSIPRIVRRIPVPPALSHLLVSSPTLHREPLQGVTRMRVHTQKFTACHY